MIVNTDDLVEYVTTYLLTVIALVPLGILAMSSESIRPALEVST
jgi:hypothetical protein